MPNKTTALSDEEIQRHKDAYDWAWKFAQLQRQALVDLKSNTSASLTYTKYTKEDLLGYMQSPKANEKNIRNASIYMYDASAQYRRLILYYAYMPLWAYTIGPLGFDGSSVKKDAFRKSYLKAAHQIENMNLKHEMQKASVVAWREGILYGAVWSGKQSYFIQRINPDICKLSSIVDGTWTYAVDFSKIKESELVLYPPEFTTLWNTYKNTGDKWQEIPDSISFCLKADETTSLYSIPPFASTLPDLYDIENYKGLQETATEIANYKVIGMQVPVDTDGTPKIDYPLAQQYYQQMVGVLPPYVGVAMSPMKMEAFNFEKSAGISDVDTVSRATEQFWLGNGTSPLLFGSADNDTAAALKLSILADEELVFGLMNQCERLVNRILKQMSGTQKFKINFLPVTIFNKQDWIANYKEAATLGIPVKGAYASTLGLAPTDVMGINYIEMDILGMGDLTPLKNSYTQSGEAGRPTTNDDQLTEAGQATRDQDANASR